MTDPTLHAVVGQLILGALILLIALAVSIYDDNKKGRGPWK